MHQNPRIPSRRSARRGFTLTELLVVIAILAVLLALGLGVKSKVTAKARSLKCLNNLREWSVVFTSSTADYNGALMTPRNWAAISHTPYDPRTDRGCSPYAPYWDEDIDKALGIQLDRRRCPCLNEAESTHGNTSPSYLLNRNLSTNYKRRYYAANHPFAGSKILFIDSKSWAYELGTNASIVEEKMKPAAESHGGVLYAVFGDFHVEAIKPETLAADWDNYVLPD
ncbi:MAG: prepilin-type N-terminal cleavage/methylation domain-containing protein [Verrucomicrobiales bacterium]